MQQKHHLGSASPAHWSLLQQNKKQTGAFILWLTVGYFECIHVTPRKDAKDFHRDVSKPKLMTLPDPEMWLSSEQQPVGADGAKTNHVYTQFNRSEGERNYLNHGFRWGVEAFSQ